MTGIAMALGPSLGGIIGSGLGWRWIFLANISFCILLGLVAPRIVVEMRDGADRPLDWLGVVILTLALAPGIDGTLEARHSPIRVVIGLAACAGLIAVFIAGKGGRRSHALLLAGEAILLATRLCHRAGLLSPAGVGAGFRLSSWLTRRGMQTWQRTRPARTART